MSTEIEFKTMNWILDNDRCCITENAEPILEASFDDCKSKIALKLASKAPKMLDMLNKVLQIQDKYYGDGIKTHLALKKISTDIEELIGNVHENSK